MQSRLSLHHMSCLTWHRSKTILLVMPHWPPLEASGHMSGQKAFQFSICTGMTLVAENKCFNLGPRPERRVCHQLRSASSEWSSRSRGPGTDCGNPCSQNWDIWMYLAASFVYSQSKAEAVAKNDKKHVRTPTFVTRPCLLFLAHNAGSLFCHKASY